MDIPGFIYPKEVPVWPTQECTHHNQGDPQHEEPNLKCDVTELPFFNGVITISTFILVVLGESEPLIQTLQGLEEGRAPHLRFELFNRSYPETIARLAMAGLLMFGGSVLITKVVAWTRTFLSE